MHYTVRISKFETVPHTEREWQKQVEKKDGDTVYDYATYETVKSVETVILQQTVDTIDLAEVIRAVNGL